MTRRWFLGGQRPRMVKDQRSRSADIFGAVCPERDTGAALALPEVSTAGMNLLLADIARQVPERRPAVVLTDTAGWHTIGKIEVPANLTPANLTPVNLPPDSAELNAIARVWQHLRDRSSSGCLFTDTAAIVEACCNAWNRRLAETGRIRSLTDRPWAQRLVPGAVLDGPQHALQPALDRDRPVSRPPLSSSQFR